MELIPICNKCGQSDEFLVSEDNRYICVCGHQFTLPDLPEVAQQNSTINPNQLKPVSSGQ